MIGCTRSQTHKTCKRTPLAMKSISKLLLVCQSNGPHRPVPETSYIGLANPSCVSPVAWVSGVLYTSAQKDTYKALSHCACGVMWIAAVAWVSGVLYTNAQMDTYKANKQTRINNEAARLATLRANESLPLVSLSTSSHCSWTLISVATQFSANEDANMQIAGSRI
eukprot:1158925-Pelagomonas_calceolata.AAC.2